MDFFITRPEHDDSTFYLSCWSKELIKLAKDRGINVFDFDKGRATAKEVEKFLSKKNPELVMFNGHGKEDNIMGYKNEILIKYGQNEKLIKGKIVYCRSCNSAKKLGKESIQSGTIAFLGYEAQFGFPFDERKTANPLRDEFARPCLDASNQIIKSLLKGNTVDDAYNSSQVAFNNWIDKLQRSDAPPEAPHIIVWLMWDKFNQKVYGEQNARLR